MNFIKTALSLAKDMRMLRDQWNILKIYLFGKTTKQIISNFDPLKS